MDFKKRAEIDINKLNKALNKAKTFSSLSKEVVEWAENYYKDSLYYYKKGDYFTAFGCANYAYGLLDALFIQAKLKEKLFEEEGI